jgi:hypothetical protein
VEVLVKDFSSPWVVLSAPQGVNHLQPSQSDSGICPCYVTYLTVSLGRHS